MKRDLKSKRFAVKKTTRKKNRNLYLILAGAMASVVLGLLVLLPRHQVKTYSTIIGAHYQNVSHWIADHRGKLKQNITKVKELATNRNAEQEPIHFEFYSELPKIQVPVPESKSTKV